MFSYLLMETLKDIDPDCTVERHPTVNYALRVRPSHPRHRDALRAKADLWRSPGLLVSIVKEVDDFGFPEQPKRSWLRRWWLK